MATANMYEFSVGEAVDMSTIYGWRFAGIIKSIDKHYAWVHFVYGTHKDIPYEKYGAWYKVGNLKTSTNPHID